tara:strand:+ start:22757 stop:23881 length:1125 start_codon:yes stop_codon:yes gene_type:complete
MSKVIIIGPASPFRGGISDLNEAFANSLAETGYDVEIVSFKLQYPSFLFPGKTQFRTRSTTPTNYKITSIINSINPISWYATFKYILKQKPSKVFVRFWMPFFGPCLGFISKRIKKNGVNIYGIVDNAIPHESRFGDRILTNYFLKSCTSHFTLSEKVKRDIITLNNDLQVVTLFHPIYNTYANLPKRDIALKELNLVDQKYILFFGLVRNYKGLDLAIEAMSHPKIKKENITLLVAGEFYDDVSKYKSLIKELKLNNIIIYDKFIDKDNVPKYFSVCNTLILPYKSATQSGVTQLAMNYECPMIVTNVGGLPEVVDHKVNGFVSEPNAKNISDAIIYFFSENTIELAMRNSMKEKKKLYSWSNFTNLIVKNTE